MAESTIEIYDILEPLMGSRPAGSLLNYIEKVKSGVDVSMQETLELYELIRPSLEPEASKLLIAFIHQQKPE